MSSRDEHLEAVMAGRPVDHQRRAELLDAVVDYTVEHGFSDLSWRPVAAALGVSPTTLVHRFGSKEQMLVAILGRLRERIFAATNDAIGENADLATAARAVWTRTSDPRRGAEFRLFFAVYGRALQAPEQFAGFLDRVVADWMNALRDAQGPGTDPATARRRRGRGRHAAAKARPGGAPGPRPPPGRCRGHAFGGAAEVTPSGCCRGRLRGAVAVTFTGAGLESRSVSTKVCPPGYFRRSFRRMISVSRGCRFEISGDGGGGGCPLFSRLPGRVRAIGSGSCPAPVQP
jgi:AcrR family transcriptional regulator